MATETARRQVAPASDRRRAGESHYEHQPGNRAELFFNRFVLANAKPNLNPNRLNNQARSTTLTGSKFSGGYFKHSFLF
jgi:hypothetical protein